MREQCLRMKSVDGYWQDGFKDHMPERDFNGKGWGINPKAKGSNASALTGENCVMWMSEHSDIGPDGKLVTMTCGCDPVKALKHNCRGCGCKWRKCSLACGCRGRCHLGRKLVPGAPTRQATYTGPAGAAHSAVVDSAMTALLASRNARTDEEEEDPDDPGSDDDDTGRSDSDSDDFLELEAEESADSDLDSDESDPGWGGVGEVNAQDDANSEGEAWF
ncbi:unnamed protein product [Ectocarpus sp. CCAP 1310/34]|nr:unnamed protein product [Ectocarpus sp. CCAP 1310/34]